MAMNENNGAIALTCRTCFYRWRRDDIRSIEWGCPKCGSGQINWRRLHQAGGASE